METFDSLQEYHNVYFLLKFSFHSQEGGETVTLMKSLLFAKLLLFSVISSIGVHQDLSSDPAHLVINTSQKGRVNQLKSNKN